MASLGELPPWISVRPQDFVQAGNEGANAGLAAAHLRQSADQHAAQLAAEHAKMQQQAAMESAHLSQQQHIAEMEMQARKEIANQNHLREQQQNLQLNAFRQSEIGLRQAQLERMQALNDAAAREKAMMYAQEAGLANHISQGGDMATGLMKFPMARGIAGALKADKPKDYGELKITPLPNGGYAVTRPGSAAVHLQNPLPDGAKIVTNSKDGSIKIVKKDGSFQVVQPPQYGTGKIMERLGLNGTNAPAINIPQQGTNKPQASVESPYQEGDKVTHKDGSVHVIQNGIPVPIDVAENTTEDAGDETVPTPEELASENA